MNKFVKTNPKLCIGCRTCMIACVVAHEGKQIFEIDPDGYDFNPRLKLKQTAKMTTTIQCYQCEDPACVKVCPTAALTHDADRIGLDQDKCVGCTRCTKACPFDSIHMVDIYVGPDRKKKRRVANKCDLCTGLGHGPACVSVCPTEALSLVDREELMKPKVPKVNKPVPDPSAVTGVQA